MRADIPDGKEFSLLKPQLNSYSFPLAILLANLIRAKLANSNIEDIKRPLAGNKPGSYIRYAAPWNSEAELQPETVDLVISQAVLEHVEELGNTYRSIFKWLKPR